MGCAFSRLGHSWSLSVHGAWLGREAVRLAPSAEQLVQSLGAHRGSARFERLEEICREHGWRHLVDVRERPHAPWHPHRDVGSSRSLIARDRESAGNAVRQSSTAYADALNTPMGFVIHVHQPTDRRTRLRLFTRMLSQALAVYAPHNRQLSAGRVLSSTSRGSPATHLRTASRTAPSPPRCLAGSRCSHRSQVRLRNRRKLSARALGSP